MLVLKWFRMGSQSSSGGWHPRHGTFSRANSTLSSTCQKPRQAKRLPSEFSSTCTTSTSTQQVYYSTITAEFRFCFSGLGPASAQVFESSMASGKDMQLKGYESCESFCRLQLGHGFSCGRARRGRGAWARTLDLLKNVFRLPSQGKAELRGRSVSDVTEIICLGVASCQPAASNSTFRCQPSHIGRWCHHRQSWYALHCT